LSAAAGEAVPSAPVAAAVSFLTFPLVSRYVLPKFAIGGPDSPSLLELKGRSGLDQGITTVLRIPPKLATLQETSVFSCVAGPSPLSVALAITRQSKRNMRDERSSDVFVAGTASPAAQKEFVWERQQRVPTSSSSGRQLQQEPEEDARVCRPVTAARAVQAASCPYRRTTTWLPGLFRFFRTPATNLRLPKQRGAISEAKQKRRRHAATARFAVTTRVGTRLFIMFSSPCPHPASLTRQYIAPIFTGSPSKDTRLVEIQQTAAAAHAQLLSYSQQVRRRAAV
jgi:hypothetical protein